MSNTTEFKVTDKYGRVFTGKNGKPSHLSPTWKWGILLNDTADVVLFRTQTQAVWYAHYMWGNRANFVLVRFCAKGSKS